MNVVYTLDQGGFLTPQARASQEAAAQRWGAEYRVLTAWPGGRKDTFGGKLELHLLDGDRCCWMDADVMIRSDCPSLFDAVPAEFFGAVPCDQGDTLDERAKVTTTKYLIAAYRYFRTAIQVPVSQYVNGGVLVWSRCHARVWQFLTGHMPEGVIGPMMEQTALNVALRMEGVGIQYLPRGYNRLGSATWNLNGPMTDYVHHWARWNDYRGDKSKAMEGVEWKV